MSIFDEIKKKEEQYKQLRKNDIVSIPDKDLREAIMFWIWGKLEKNWTKEFEVICGLPKLCQDVYSCCSVVDEIGNGGINQLFFNSTRQFVEMAIEGFIAIGNKTLSDILEKALIILRDNIEILDKYMDDSIENFSASYEENLFNDLDDVFCEEESNFESQVIEYIRKNQIYFGD